MGVRIGIRNNWVPPRLYVRPLPRVVDPNKWWTATNLVSQNASYTTAGIASASYVSPSSTITDQFGWNSASLAPDFNKSFVLSNPSTIIAAAPPADAFGWNATSLTPDFSFAQGIPTTGTENIQGSGVADNAWWAATGATVISGPKTSVSSTSYNYIQDQATPANDNWWTQTSATATSTNAGQVSSNGYNYIQDQATPANNAWWQASGATVVAGPKTSMPDPASYNYIQDQATPADNTWWAQNSATVVNGPVTTVPTTNYDYDQDQATPADIGWWSYAGE